MHTGHFWIINLTAWTLCINKFVFMILNPVSLGWDILPQGLTHADMILNHVVYNPETFGQYIEPDYKLIVPAREPVSWSKSMVMDSGVCIIRGQL